LQQTISNKTKQQQQEQEQEQQQQRFVKEKQVFSSPLKESPSSRVAIQYRYDRSASIALGKDDSRCSHEKRGLAWQ